MINSRLIVIRISLLFFCVIFSGCRSQNVQPDPPQIELVKIPVHVDCLGKLPIKPDLISDAELTVLKPGAFVTALHIDRLKRDAYIAELEAVLEGCK